MKTEKLTDREISVGQALPWAAYDNQGMLLLQKGSIISSDRQLQALLERGLYRNDAETKQPGKESKIINDHASPFDKFHHLIDRVTKLFSAIILKQGNVQEKVYKVCNDIQEISLKYPDAALGAIHLCHEIPYSICHSIHVAILSSILANRYGCNDSQVQSTLAAALTSNISMLELQEILQHQQAPLTDEQKQQIREHPMYSVEMLKAAGVDDEVWLKIIAQHHERPDGKGYPLGIIKDNIRIESLIISLTDRYAAMVSARSYREPMTSREVLREFFLAKDTEFNESLILSFIKELGVFPPGSIVSLKNGETAIVIKRGKGKMWPMASSILGPANDPYARPLRRDCNEEKYTITDTCKLGNSLHIGLNMVWGF
jgi:HD-GYP domain-containing protein (c-di-GMP phosphodiesterase class II)